MKRIVLGLLITGAALFAAVEKEEIKGCIELKLTEATSMISCPHGDYKASFETTQKGIRYTSSEVKIEVLSKEK